ncbi:MAG: hypothetical protein AAB288_03255, partial [Acidobacteriota bacterium]
MRHSTSFALLRSFFSVALLVALATVAHAQFRAGVQGVVTDGAGATVGGAVVTLLNKETNQSQSTQT